MVVITGPGGHHRHRHRRLPGVRHHRRHHGHHQAQLARSPTPRTSRGWWPRPSTSPPPVGPGPVLIDVPKDISNATMEWYWPASVDDLDLPGYHPMTDGRPRADRARRPSCILAARAPRHLRRRRHPQGPGRRGPARAGRAHRHPGGHHPDGPGRLPRLATRCAWACPGMHGNYTAVTAMQRVRPAHRPRAAGSTTGSPARSAPSPPRPRSSTSTSTRPSSARCAGPTWPSPATAGWSSRSCCWRWTLGLAHSEATVAAGGARAMPCRRTGCAGSVADVRPDLAPWRPSSASGRSAFPLAYDQEPRAGALKPQFVVETLRDATPDDTIVVAGRGPAPDVGLAVLEVRPPLHLGELRAGWAPWASPCPPPSGPRWAGPTRWCGPSTATAASR